MVKIGETTAVSYCLIRNLPFCAAHTLCLVEWVYLFSTIVPSPPGLWSLPVMTEKRVVQEGGEPSCRSARCPRSFFFPLPPEAAKQAIRVNSKALTCDKSTLNIKRMCAMLMVAGY